MTHDCSSRMTSAVYRNIPSASLQRNVSSLIGRHFITHYVPHLETLHHILTFNEFCDYDLFIPVSDLIDIKSSSSTLLHKKKSDVTWLLYWLDFLGLIVLSVALMSFLQAAFLLLAQFL